MTRNYDQTDPKSIEAFARKAVGKSLHRLTGKEESDLRVKGKGKFGQVLEKHYFGINPGNESAPDFPEAGVELKSFPVLKGQKGFRAKERLVFNVINYETIHKETWEKSHFLKKNSLLLLVGYLYRKDEDYLEHLIKLAKLWRFPEEDVEIIKGDWQKIVAKIRKGEAHLLSEGDTLYLGACTKGASSKTKRAQPFSEILAKQRAFSLKQGYLSSILGGLIDAGEVVHDAGEIREVGFEEVVSQKFKPFIGMTDDEIQKKLRVDVKKEAKNRHAVLARAMMGVRRKKVAEFEKADVKMKTIRLEKSGVPEQSMSFPYFKYMDIVAEEWETSTLRGMFSKRFFFVVWKRDETGNLRLKQVKFWTMPIQDLDGEVRKVWRKTFDRIRSGKADDLPKESESDICHVRPHGRNAVDTAPAPDGMSYTKKCFWLNRKYIASVTRD